MRAITSLVLPCVLGFIGGWVANHMPGSVQAQQKGNAAVETHDVLRTRRLEIVTEKGLVLGSFAAEGDEKKHSACLQLGDHEKRDAKHGRVRMFYSWCEPDAEEKPTEPLDMYIEVADLREPFECNTAIRRDSIQLYRKRGDGNAPDDPSPFPDTTTLRACQIECESRDHVARMGCLPRSPEEGGNRAVLMLLNKKDKSAIEMATPEDPAKGATIKLRNGTGAEMVFGTE